MTRLPGQRPRPAARPFTSEARGQTSITWRIQIAAENLLLGMVREVGVTTHARSKATRSMLVLASPELRSQLFQASQFLHEILVTVPR